MGPILAVEVVDSLSVAPKNVLRPIGVCAVFLLKSGSGTIHRGLLIPFLLLFLSTNSAGAEPLRSRFPVPLVCWEGTREEAYEMGSLHDRRFMSNSNAAFCVKLGSSECLLCTRLQ